MATLRWTDGKVYDVPDDKVQQALADGFQPVNAERLAASEQPVKAGVEAAVRTALPLGIGQELMTGFQMGASGESREDVLRQQSLRQQENPLASAVGTGVGFVAPSKLLGAATVPLRARGLAGIAAAGALEGSALGLNEAVNESILENKPLTAEKLASNVIEAGAVGAAFDFGMGAVGKGASAALKKMGGGALSKTLQEAGTKTSLNMIESKRWAKKYGAFEDDIARVAREEGVLTRATDLSDASVEAAKAAEQRVWGQMAQKLDEAQYLKKPNYNEITDKVLGAIKQYDRNPLADTAMQEVQDVLEATGTRRLTYRELWDVQRSWRVKAEDATTLRADVLSDARRALRDAIMDAAPQGVGTLGDTLRDLNKRYAAISAFADGLEDAATSFKARGMGIKEMLAGAYVGGVPGAGVALGTHTLRKRGGFALGETLYQLGKSETVEAISKSLHRNLSQRLAVAPDLLGPFRNTLEAALLQGPEATLETHSQLAMSRVGPEYLATLGMEAETPEQVQAIGKKLSVYDALQQAGNQRDSDTQSAIDGLFGSAPGRKGSLTRPLTVKDFEKFRDFNRQVLADPESAYARIPPEIAGAASETAGLAAMTMLNAARFLDSKMPKDPYAGMPDSVRPQWQPSAAELDRFSRYKEAVESPARVLKNMANGYLAPEQVEALKAVYPAIYADLQQKIGERLATWQKPLSYKQKLAFSAILGPKALGMSPQQVQILQQSMTVAPQSGKSMKGPDGRQDVNEEQMETEAQKLEAR